MPANIKTRAWETEREETERRQRNVGRAGRMRGGRRGIVRIEKIREQDPTNPNLWYDRNYNRLINLAINGY